MSVHVNKLFLGKHTSHRIWSTSYDFYVFLFVCSDLVLGIEMMRKFSCMSLLVTMLCIHDVRLKTLNFCL